MLALKLRREPEWVNLGAGVRVLAQPIDSVVMMAARADLAGADEDGDANILVVLMTKAVARLVISDWEGVGDEDGAPMAVTREGIDALMDLHRFCEAFNARVLAPYLEIQREKNASSPLPNGTSEGAGATANTAKRSARSARAN